MSIFLATYFVSKSKKYRNLSKETFWLRYCFPGGKEGRKEGRRKKEQERKKERKKEVQKKNKIPPCYFCFFCFVLFCFVLFFCCVFVLCCVVLCCVVMFLPCPSA